jgi:hypothetical protein
MKHIQNNQKSIGNFLPVYGFLKKSMNQKSRDFCQMFVTSPKKENNTLGYGFENP